MRISRLVIAAVFLFIAAPAGYHIVSGHLKRIEEQRRLQEIYTKKEAAWNVLALKLRSETDRFKGKAGIFIKDLEYGFEFRHNEDELFAAASLAKVPIMGAVYKASYEGRLDLDNEMALSQTDKLTGSGILRYKAPGEVFTIRELIDLMVSISDNTATNMVTSAMGMDYINDSIRGFGMSNSLLVRRVADYDARRTGLENYTTARDMALILDNIYKGQLFNEEVSARSLEMLLGQKKGDRIPRYIPGDVPVAHKTGLERGVCHDVGIVFDPDGPFLICVLTGHSNPNSIPSKNFIARISKLTYERHEITRKEEESFALSPSLDFKLSSREVQRFLKNKGLYAGSIDGIVGPQTRRAIRAFQTSSGIVSDGIIGPETGRAIMEDSAFKGEVSGELR